MVKNVPQRCMRGSLMSLEVSSLVLTMVVVTRKFSNPLTLALGVEVLTVKQGAAEKATTGKESDEAGNAVVGEMALMNP